MNKYIYTFLFLVGICLFPSCDNHKKYEKWANNYIKETWDNLNRVGVSSNLQRLKKNEYHGTLTLKSLDARVDFPIVVKKEGGEKNLYFNLPSQEAVDNLVDDFNRQRRQSTTDIDRRNEEKEKEFTGERRITQEEIDREWLKGELKKARNTWVDNNPEEARRRGITKF